METDFHLVGEVGDIEVIAANLSIRERKNLKTRFGGRRWRKLKGTAMVRFPNGEFGALNYIGMKPMALAGVR